jgi:hypothetical protein
MKPLSRSLAATVLLFAIAACGNNTNRASFRVRIHDRPATTVTMSTAPARELTPAATTSPAPTTPPPSVLGNASAELLPADIQQLVIADPHPDGYDRDFFGGWIDADHDCQNTRAEALIAESQVPVTFTSAASCTVVTGQWTDPWSGTVTTSASSLDVDHTVPLANAWRSGAWAWTPEQRVAYANDLDDPDHLIGIPLGENRSKSDDGPEAWRPPARSAWCLYARVWTAIKAKWSLTATPAEWAAILQLASTC